MKVRRAKIADVKSIHKLINGFAKNEEMLPRALNDLYENVRDFFIYEESGELRGICALRVVWEDLAEVRSLAVRREDQGRGVGTALLKRCLRDARELGIKRVFALTYLPEFFEKMGFKEIDKVKLPHKIWGDCLKCPKFPECNEHAVIIIL
ncbi:MAG: N-acetyltransferase [Alphaproteobacteria bacterium]|uniref:N-acetyltransferase n=1 Tax=Candidatus Nitrobium versatile TaxID=2884831 RepID=A0A953JF92_9BACT|nr:N-acetyltransferase [Candidatus Nitrobium versatile]